jgi:hypothetical protein
LHRGISGSPVIIDFSILFTFINQVDAKKNGGCLAPILSMLAVSDVNPDKDERLFPTPPGLNGDDACANFLQLIL